MYNEYDDWDGDKHRNRDGEYFRLYLDASEEEIRWKVICVGGDDYYNYDARLILSPLAWDYQHQAETDLLTYLKMFDRVLDGMSYYVELPLRARLIARRIRDIFARKDQIEAQEDENA